MSNINGMNKIRKYEGCIIEESLSNKDIITLFDIVRTEIVKVTETNATPWLKNWTMHMVEMDEMNIDDVVIKLKSSLNSEGNWYADLKNEDYHYIIFNDKVFKVNRSSREQYNEVKLYGLARGIPAYQLPDESWAKR